MLCPIKGCPQPGHTGESWDFESKDDNTNTPIVPGVIFDPDTGAVVTGVRHVNGNPTETRSNIHLIAAAPDMAHALAELVEASERLAVEGRDCGYDTYIEIRTSLKTALMAAEAALKKAGAK